MEMPVFIEFIDDCQRFLCQSLLAEAPYEGCALLIGNQKKSDSLAKENYLRIHMIWPCCNVWEPKTSNLLESIKEENNPNKEDLSKKNRFLIDPKEQFLAQRWARKNNLEVVGSAHSHPHGEPIPSAIDLLWAFSPRLIVIVGKSGEVRAWWIGETHTSNPKEVAILES